MKDLHITLIQSVQHWHNPEANRRHFAGKIALAGTTDIIALPEMFTTGFTMQTEYAEDWSGGDCESLAWMKDHAASAGAHLCGSIAVREGGSCYNRLLWVQPDGHWYTYDKRHLFSMAGEHEKYRPGQSLLVTEVAGWRIRPLICYDLRFPVWSRNHWSEGRAAYDVLLYIANWPVPRIAAWKTLLHARAIENACYAAGLNRVGTDGNGMEYSGDSLVCDFRGNTLLHSQQDELMQTVLVAHTLEEYRSKFPGLRDADPFQLV